MTLKDYIYKKVPPKSIKDFLEHWEISNESEDINNFWLRLQRKKWNEITAGIELIGYLEITEMENILIDYSKKLLESKDLFDRSNGKSDIFETIMWTLGKIGTDKSLIFLKDICFGKFPKYISMFQSLGNFSHIISACQFSYLLLSNDQILTKIFFDKTMKYRSLPIPNKNEIEIHKKSNKKYAHYLEYLYNNYS
ncbi:MAG: hypothetical protein FJW56_05855 [Actinobacteria bacterium]|nr:hypothetical protein [Actinomycetota bacterium]